MENSIKLLRNGRRVSHNCRPGRMEAIFQWKDTPKLIGWERFQFLPAIVNTPRPCNSDPSGRSYHLLRPRRLRLIHVSR